MNFQSNSYVVLNIYVYPSSIFCNIKDHKMNLYAKDKIF